MCTTKRIENVLASKYTHSCCCRCLLARWWYNSFYTSIFVIASILILVCAFCFTTLHLNSSTFCMVKRFLCSFFILELSHMRVLHSREREKLNAQVEEEQIRKSRNECNRRYVLCTMNKWGKTKQQP